MTQIPATSDSARIDALLRKYFFGVILGPASGVLVVALVLPAEFPVDPSVIVVGIRWMGELYGAMEPWQLLSAHPYPLTICWGLTLVLPLAIVVPVWALIVPPNARKRAAEKFRDVSRSEIVWGVVTLLLAIFGLLLSDIAFSSNYRVAAIQKRMLEDRIVLGGIASLLTSSFSLGLSFVWLSVYAAFCGAKDN